MSEKQSNLTSGHRLARNVLWNLFGTGAPLLVAIIAIPMLIEGLGMERFGVLTLAWMVVGYFSLFDLGLGRALTKLVAEKLANGQDDEMPSLIWTAMSLMGVLGVVGAIVVAVLCPWLVNKILNIPVELKPETLTAFYMLAASIPIVISSTGLRGVLEAHQCFGLVNMVRIPLGVLTFLGPLAVLPFSNSLVPVVALLIVARFVSWVAYMVFCLKVEPTLRCSVNVQREMVKPLLSFGGWLTVTNIVGPLMVYMDRFLIGVVVTMTAVTYYVTPYEIVTKLGIVPGALMGVMFPAFVATFGRDKTRAARLFRRTINYIFLLLFPAVLIIVTFAKEGLTLWLGTEIAENSSLVLQLLAVGVFVNSFARVPSGMVQGAGRPDLTAKLHLMELPLYILILWWLVGAYGIVGAAIAWLLRVIFDTIILFVMAQRLLPLLLPFLLRAVLVVGVALPALALGYMIPVPSMKGVYLLLILSIFVLVAWFVILATDERKSIQNRLKVMQVFS